MKWAVLCTLALVACALVLAAAEEEAKKPRHDCNCQGCVPCKPHDGLEHSKEAITVESKAPKASLKKVTVIHPPEHKRRHKKWKGDFKHRPLLDNGREFLKFPYKMQYKHDACTGCPVPVIKNPKHDPRNRLDKKGRVIGRKKVLPVVPELRARRHRKHRKHGKKHHKKHHKKHPKKHHVRPHFYPLSRKQVKKIKKREHHRKVLRRLPKHPHYYPPKKPARLYNPPGGWPCDNCLKKGEVPRSPLPHSHFA